MRKKLRRLTIGYAAVLSVLLAVSYVTKYSIELEDNYFQLTCAVLGLGYSLRCSIKKPEIRFLQSVAGAFACFTVYICYWTLHLVVKGQHAGAMSPADFSWFGFFCMLISADLGRTGSFLPEEKLLLRAGNVAALTAPAAVILVAIAIALQSGEYVIDLLNFTPMAVLAFLSFRIFLFCRRSHRSSAFFLATALINLDVVLMLVFQAYGIMAGYFVFDFLLSWCLLALPVLAEDSAGEVQRDVC